MSRRAHFPWLFIHERIGLRSRRLLQPATSGARIAGWRGREICRARWAEQLTKDRLQRVCPDLVPRNRGMQLVPFVQYAIEQLPLRIRQTIVDRQEANARAVREPGELLVESVDRRHDGH